MKKRFGLYLIIWAVLLVVFNVISIVSPGWATIEKTTPTFWIGYAFINATFVGQLICAWMAFKDESAKKSFLNVSLFTTSYAGLIATFVIAGICMLISPLSGWISAIVCTVVLAINIIAVVKAKIAIELVAEVEKKVEKATSFIYDKRVESDSLLARAKTDDAKAICVKVCDAFKYSDPMSNSDLATVEEEIQAHFTLLKKAIIDGNMEDATAESEEVLALIAERNNKCKRLK
jgi:hypothetical protein